MGQKTEKDGKSYRPTLNLPKTSFSMKANLVQNEPAALKRWRKDDLYAQVRQARAGRPKFVFHDGPPYANGSIHLGHLLNKVLKDMVVRSRTMAGFDCPYVPGWDCHGLPIEHRVMQELREKAAGMAPMQIRKRCHDYAAKFVKHQSRQMQRLLTLADYDDPYLTMAPAYEAATLEVFADLVARGLVYRDLKPVHWSIANQTALAEAELEYEQREDTSVYVLFEVLFETSSAQWPDALNVPADAEAVQLMIWTTTPWTLPANLAVAVHERFDYGLYRFTHKGRPCLAVLACELAPRVFAAGECEGELLGTARGADLVGVEYRHPFIDRTGRVVAADYVTSEDGTGMVHTAPGHGVEDYQTGLRENLDIYCPVQDDGTFDDTAPQWLRGLDVWKGNELVVQQLLESGHLFHHHAFTHSYPHDWRSKTPVIFRATEQWFVAVDVEVDRGGTLRQRAMSAAGSEIRFIPEWGRNRMRGMLESRPDWCLSRQRSWGLPIPAFFGPQRGQFLLTAASVRAVAGAVRQEGSDCWFRNDPDQLLAAYRVDDDPDAPEWLRALGAEGVASLRKAVDIFDVWFESGSSWNAVIRQRATTDHRDYPTDLYLEGSDQHRGWFQLSLLPSLGVTGQSPFRSVLTHGFMVDKHGRKMSKSLGNTIEVDDLMKDYGADVCRWWVASLNTDNDIKVDAEFFKLAGEEYRKVRNTIRFLLGNLVDFDGQVDARPLGPGDAMSIDAWAAGELARLIDQVRRSYDDLHFRGAAEAIFTFCNETMSAVYLAAVKDRLYCDRPDGPRRRRCQSVMHEISHALPRLLAPILPYTAEEIWRALHDKGDGTPSVHLELLPDAAAVEVDERWPAVLAARDQWLKRIEQSRQDHDLDNPLDCGVRVAASDLLTGFDLGDLADLCGVSRFEVGAETDGIEVVDLRAEPRCDRSWKRDPTVRSREDGGMLSDRDAEAVGV